MIRLIITVVLMFLLHGCIDRYHLDEHYTIEPKLVFDACITDDSEIQEIIVSASTPTDEVEFIPVNDLIIMILDEEENVFPFTLTSNPGHYRGIIGKEYFHAGAEFKLKAISSQGTIESNYEPYLPSPPVDSIYYEVVDRPTNNIEETETGVQFFLDFYAPDSYGSYYRFDVVETYEFHSTYEIDAYYDYGFHFTPNDSSLYFCYKTWPIDRIYTLSTLNFTENTYIKYNLHFVNNRTQRLKHQYSILLRQYSLSEDAYFYWERLKQNNQETGNMFVRQPAQVLGNLYYTDDEEKQVLGYFGVSDIQEKRIIYSQGIQDIEFDMTFKCVAVPLKKPLDRTSPESWPIYLVEVGSLSVAPKWCFDCRLHGGVLQKPDFFE